MSAYADTLLQGHFTRPVYSGNLDACQQQGEAAADQAYPRTSNPYPQGSAEREWWDSGWCNSGDELCGER